MANSRKKVMLSWSSGKDAAYALYRLRQDPTVEICGLLTTFNEAFQRAAMHGVRQEILLAQAAAAGLPLQIVQLPWPCSNEDYQKRMQSAIEALRADGITHLAFGDLFLEDVRDYRIASLMGTGLEPLFPLWGIPTTALAEEMLEAGLEALLVCIDPRQLDPAFLGCSYNRTLLNELPDSVDPCGERGEFHTCCYAGPMFRSPIVLKKGIKIERDGFWYQDLLLEQ